SLAPVHSGLLPQIRLATSQLFQSSCKRVQPCSDCLPEKPRTQQKPSVEAGSARCADSTPQRGVPTGPANSLYKHILLPAALACAKIGPSLDIPASWSVLRMRPGSGTKARGSAPQAGHDPAKR